MGNRVCRNCYVEIPKGTNAKRAFCSSNCRNDYNLERRNERDREILEYINGILKNYQVLRIWEGNSELSITILQLIDNGFSIDFLPESRKDKKGDYYGFGHFKLYILGDCFSDFLFINTRLI